MQLFLGFDEINEPFVIATDRNRTEIYLVNVNTQYRIPLIDLNNVHRHDDIIDIQQTSKLQDPKKAMHYTNLQEIMIHFKLSQHNKDGCDL